MKTQMTPSRNSIVSAVRTASVVAYCSLIAWGAVSAPMFKRPAVEVSEVALRGAENYGTALAIARRARRIIHVNLLLAVV